MSTRIKKRPKSQSATNLVALGSSLLKQGQHAKAEQAWRQAAEADPCCADAWRYLTEFLALSERVPEALACLSRLIAVSERTADRLYELADKCSFLNLYPQARDLLQQAFQLNPSRETWLAASLLLIKIDFAEDDWLKAVEGANRILQVEPRNKDALLVRQRSYFCLTWSVEDVADHRMYLEIWPEADRHHRLLLKLNLLHSTTPELLYEESVRWAKLYVEPLASQIVPHRNTPDPERRIKVGYISPDFRNHTIMKLLAGVLENHDKQRFEIYAYAIATERDEATNQVQKWVDHFVELPSVTKDVARRIRQDGIDLLVDLAGHTMPVEAMLALGWKPAPIQMTWMGTLATTGMPVVDYFIGDEYLPCPGTEHLFTETVYRLPRVSACFRSNLDVGLVAPPYFQNGYITFGSLNDPRKINRECVKVWSVILHLHPTSKLFIKALNMEHEIVQRRLRDWFQEDGIDQNRLTFEGLGPLAEFQRALNRVDIALDPFPYTGGTTTLETLWMGVPVVSLSGRLAVARSGMSILAAVGLPVAASLEQYVALAVRMAQAIPQQPDSRAQLRATFRKSQLMDEKGMTQAMENAYLDMWRKWCEKSGV